MVKVMVYHYSCNNKGWELNKTILLSGGKAAMKWIKRRAPYDKCKE